MEADQVGWLQDLDPLDHYLVHAFRNAAVALGHGCEEHRDAARTDLARITRALDRTGTLRRFWSLMTTLGTQARRQVRFHVPDCPCLGADEAAFLQLCAHLRRGERVAATGIANGLVQGEAVARLMRHAAVIVNRLREPAPQWPPSSPAQSGPSPRARTQPTQAGQRLH